jgi:hypothetical protein
MGVSAIALIGTQLQELKQIPGGLVPGLAVVLWRYALRADTARLARSS